MFTAKPDDLNSNTWTYTGENNSHKLSSDLHTQTMACMHSHLHMITCRHVCVSVREHFYAYAHNMHTHKYVNVIKMF